ncbi:MAG: glycosyltransferase family 1 protein [Spirochaetes bacterium]|nr:glycosyltransferase family 1 protein [Spirochaetota bacterium]
MKVVLSTRGSRGDVHPVIEVAAALKRAGCEVSLSVPHLFGDHARSMGLDPLLYPEDSELVMQELGSGLAAIRTSLDWFSRAIDEQFEYLMAESADADCLLTSVNEVAVPTIAEYRGITHYRLAYTPVLPGRQPPPLIPWQGLPGTVNRGLWSAINGVTAFIVRDRINSKRHELGLAPMGGINAYFTARSRTLLAINRTLAPPCRTWDARYNYAYTGYCHGTPGTGLDPALEHFLDTGPAPVYIGFGSVSLRDAADFTRTILRAVARAGCRIVLGTGWTGLGGGDLPESVFPVGDTDHALLFTRCAAVAHHGGCGTVHTAARAGVPQFIMPQIADQFYWGDRIHRLGLGPAPIPPGSLTSRKLAGILTEMVGNTAYARNAARLAVDMHGEDGVTGVVGIVLNDTGFALPEREPALDTSRKV